MSKHTDHGRGKGSRLVVLLAVMATLGAALAFSFGSVAQADTTASPDTNTRAVLAPATTAATCNPTPPAAAATPCATASNGAVPASAPTETVLAGAVGGDFVSIHIDGATASFFGVTQTRLCRGSLNDVSLSAQLSPSNGDCLPASAAGITGAEPGNGNHSAAGSSPANTYLDYTFSIGQGTYTPPGGTAITCGPTSPCSLWIQESVNNASDASGNVFKHYQVTYAGAPGAPTVTSTPNNQQLSVSITPPSNDGNTSSALKYTWTVSGGDCGGATPPAGCGTPFTDDTATSHTLALTNFQQYTISITAKSTGANGTSTFVGPAGTAGPNASTTPVPPPPTNVQGTPADGQVSLTWTAPTGPTPTSYDVLSNPGPGSGANPRNTGSSATNFTFTNLQNGTVYTFQVRAVYPGGTGQYSAASGPITPQGKFITQTITVVRPQGDLVLTQVCGAHGATTTGTAPTLGSAPGGPPDPLFSQYPYPTDANGVPNPNYPTNCGINMGNAHFVTSGAGAGQFFEATGLLNQVTVADTRDADPGFTVNGQMGSFSNGGPNPHDSFSGSELGWTPVKTSDTPGFTASDGTTYDQTVAAGPVVAPNTPNATGLSTGGVLGQANAGQGLGIAVLDANLKLWIPVYANHGTYTGTLTISAI